MEPKFEAIQNKDQKTKEEWSEYKEIKRGHYINPESDWKNLYDSYFTEKEVLIAYENMVDAGVVPRKQDDFVFVSPSANIPTQEKIIYNKDRLTRKGQSQFLIGDWVMSSLKKKNKEFFEEIEELPNFNVTEWDAENLPIKENSTDMIWEIKGWAWHVANEIKRDSAKEKFLETLEKYYTILKQGGCLVIDNMPEMDTEFEAYTPSTVLKINELDSKYGNIWEELNKKFEIFDLGEGKSKLKILRKKYFLNNLITKTMEPKFGTGLEAPKKPQEIMRASAEVRELSSEEFWGGAVSLENISEDEFAEKIKEVASDANFTYSGYILAESNDYHFSRYPRRAFGAVAPIEEYQKALNKLAEKLGTNGEEEKRTNEPRFRVLLGLEEGYGEHKKKSVIEEIDNGIFEGIADIKAKINKLIGDSLKENGLSAKLDELNTPEEIKIFLQNTNLGKEHSTEEVEKELGEGFDLRKASIYSAGPWGDYRESAVVIEGTLSDLQKIYDLAEKFKQARIAVENLQKGESFMVETAYCEDPDKE